MKQVRRNRKILGYNLDVVTFEENGQTKTDNWETTTQRNLIFLLIRSGGKSNGKVAEHLGRWPSSFSGTLERESLKFSEFLKIYEFCTGEEFKTGNDFVDSSNWVYDELTLNQVVSYLESNKKPFVVQFGGHIKRLIQNKK